MHERIGHHAEHDGERDDACDCGSFHLIDNRAYTTADHTVVSIEADFSVGVDPTASARALP